MDKRIMYTNADGGLSIVIPAPQARVTVLVAEAVWKDGELVTPERRRPETDDEFLDRIIEQDVPPGADFEVVDAADIPADRTFRGAWKKNGAAVDTDMDKAREIHKDRIRTARAPLLAALDIEYQRADERGDQAAKEKVAQRKQQLRDATDHPTIDAATTPEELKQAWPEEVAASP